MYASPEYVDLINYYFIMNLTIASRKPSQKLQLITSSSKTAGWNSILYSISKVEWNKYDFILLGIIRKKVLYIL
mgnify:CR=1 FL=1